MLFPLKSGVIGVFVFFFINGVHILFSTVATAQSHSVVPGMQIVVNQAGFYPNAPKLAIVTGDGSASRFIVVDAKTKKEVYRGALSAMHESQNSSTKTRDANFSSWKKTGSYFIAVPGMNNSALFKISIDVHHEVGVAVLKAYFFQRASMPLDSQFADKWHREEGHPDTAVIVHPSAASVLRPEGTTISTPGGWYDAGDYNKYIVNSGISTGTLLSAYEDFPVYFYALKTKIPESRNRVPDILDEVLYNMRWMLKMQDPADGGVYHKCTNANFDRMIMPDLATKPRYIVQKGTAATLDFAAVMAQGSRIFRKFDKELPGLADSCLAAAGKAWKWALIHPKLAYNQTAMNRKFEPAITTGEYDDNVFTDEWFWASAELYASTGNPEYYTALEKGLNNTLGVPNWSNVQMMGYFALLHNDVNLPAAAKNTEKRIRLRLIAFADSLVTNQLQNAFSTVIGHSKNDFKWGSNSLAANQGIILVNAYMWTNNKGYLLAALNNLDYLLGRNATGYCFVTGIGSHSSMHPHHRPSIADSIADPVPGFLVGGPNPGMQDGSYYPFTEPETAYVDLNSAFACNEVAINWNAPMVYLVNAIEALQVKSGFLKTEEK